MAVLTSVSDARIPPHNLQAELSMLGVLMNSADARTNGLQLLSGSDFYQSSHRWIFEAIQELHASGDPVDVVTVGDVLRRDDMLEHCGGQRTLASIT